MSTEKLETKTGASHVVTSGEYGRKVTEEARRLYIDHQHSPCKGNCKVTPATFRAAAERIVQLEEALRSRDQEIVGLHGDVRHWHEEADGAHAEACYWKAKATDGTS